jgi:hypothetical protein
MELRLADTSALPEELRRVRAQNLDVLHAYRQAAVFPHNIHAPGRIAPVFIDREGRRCAVAQLMIESGAGTTAAKIAEQSNLARIREMDAATLAEWVPTSGFTAREVARIQPGYCAFTADVHPAIQQVFWLAFATIQILLINSGLLIIRRVPDLFGVGHVGRMRRVVQTLTIVQWALASIAIVLSVLTSTKYGQLAGQLASLIECVGENVGIDTSISRKELLFQVQNSYPEYMRLVLLWVPLLIWLSVGIIAIELLFTWHRHARRESTKKSGVSD